MSGKRTKSLRRMAIAAFGTNMRKIDQDDRRLAHAWSANRWSLWAAVKRDYRAFAQLGRGRVARYAVPESLLFMRSV